MEVNMDTCVCCGAYVPEGRWVCSVCEKTDYTDPEWGFGKKEKKQMTKVRVTNPYHNETFVVNKELESFKSMFNNHINAVGYVSFEDISGTLVTISPDKFASVEIFVSDK